MSELEPMDAEPQDEFAHPDALGAEQQPAREPAEQQPAEEPTEERGRRSKAVDPPEMPSGYRSSRRGSRAAKSAKRAQKVFQVREAVTRTADGVHRGAWVGVRVLGMSLAAAVVSVVVLALLATGVNAAARWLALRQRRADLAVQAEKARENILVVGVKGDRATGFLALRVAAKEHRVFGLAIPDGAFMEVPGQGFERIGDSFHAGPGVSMAAISNYLSVSFERHVVVDSAVYQEIMQKQSVAGVLSSAKGGDLDAAEKRRLAKTMDSTPSNDVLIVALPVRPISVGDATYLEPRRSEVADLIESWWGVKVDSSEEAARIIVYNGSGVPGIAGVAAQELIRDGYRVVDTKNADGFGYKETLVIVQHPGEVDPAGVRKALGTGKVVEQTSDQRIADVIVIIGKDYEPDRQR